MRKTLRLIISIVVCEAIGLAATPFTIAAIATWYQGLNKPSFSPPNWVFAPAWITLYLLMGVAAYLIWEKGIINKKVKRALIFFLIQLLFNFFWSILFFGLRSPIYGFVDIVLLWLAILITILKFYKISRTTAFLMLPYLAWVTFAAILNFSIIILNVR